MRYLVPGRCYTYVTNLLITLHIVTLPHAQLMTQPKEKLDTIIFHVVWTGLYWVGSQPAKAKRPSADSFPTHQQAKRVPQETQH